jgi:hypothetical protein
VLIAVSAFAIGFSLTAAAQTSLSADNSASGQNYSSSTDYRAYLSTDALLGYGSSAEPSASASSASSSALPQYGGSGGRQSSYPTYEGRWSHLAFEGGVGFTAPLGPDTNYSTTYLNDGYLSPSEGWGYNLELGAGWNFTKKFGALLEYRFDKQDIPNSYLNELSVASGAGTQSTSGLGGNINTWSFTIDPVYYLPLSRKSGFYVTGGGGFYRKVTNFTEPVDEYSYYGVYAVPVTVDHYSSNQGGAEGGVGFYRKFFGEDSNAKFFAQIKYVWVNSPGPTSSNYYQGNGTEELLPVTFGIRF